LEAPALVCGLPRAAAESGRRTFYSNGSLAGGMVGGRIQAGCPRRMPIRAPSRPDASRYIVPLRKEFI
jgi:hypothetical protein